MKPIYFLILFALIAFSCTTDSDFHQSNSKLALVDSVNLAELGSYVVSDFNYAKVDKERTIIVDFFGAQLFGFKNGKEKFYQLNLKEVDMLEGNLQVGNIAFNEDKRFLYFPNLSKIVVLDQNNGFVQNIQLETQYGITADKFNSLFEYRADEDLFYITLYRNAHKNQQYADVPLIGAFNWDGDLVKTIGEYPDNYRDIAGNLSGWKFSFFDKNDLYYYAVFNRNNLVFKYNKNFELQGTIELPPHFIATKNPDGKILNSFRKHPTKNIFYIVENEDLTMDDGTAAVKVRLKWFNADTKMYGEQLLKNYMRIYQISEDDTIILFDRNSNEDAYLNFYKILN